LRLPTRGFATSAVILALGCAARPAVVRVVSAPRRETVIVLARSQAPEGERRDEVDRDEVIRLVGGADGGIMSDVRRVGSVGGHVDDDDVMRQVRGVGSSPSSDSEMWQVRSTGPGG
jgi:hypothetical protein